MKLIALFLALIAPILASPALAAEPDYVTAGTAGAFTVTTGVFTMKQSLELNSDWRALLPQEHEAVDKARENLAQAKASNVGISEARAALKAEKENLALAQKKALRTKFEKKEQKLKLSKIKVRSVARLVSGLGMIGAGYFSAQALIGQEKEFQPFVIESQGFEPKRPTGVSGMLLESYQPSLEADTAE
jgi:hypothetical protein